MVLPFYDSFIFNNIMSFSSCIPDFSFCSPTFFVEDNNYCRVLLFNKEAPIFEYYSKNKEGFSQVLGWSYVETNPEILKELRKYF